MSRAVAQAVVWLSIASSIPFIVLGIWLYRIHIFGFTLSALLTIVVTLVLGIGLTLLSIQAGAVALLKQIVPHLPKLLTVGFAALLAWLALSWMNVFFVSDMSARALQPVIMGTLTVFGLIFFFAVNITGQMHRWVLALSGLVGALIIIIGQAITGGIDFLYPPLSQFLLIPLALLLFFGARYLPALLAVPIILHAILLTGARMPTAVAILLIGLGAFLLPSLKKWTRFAIVSVSAGVVAGHFLSRDFVKERWFGRGDGQIVLPAPSVTSSTSSPAEQASMPAEQASIVINSSGRVRVWQHLLESITPQTFVTGNGSGFSGQTARDLTGGSITNALNEYLRLLVDFGPTVLAFWVIALGCFFVFGLINARYDRAEAFLLLGVLVALGTMSLTDIPMLLLGFMLPFVVVVGQSLRSLVVAGRLQNHVYPRKTVKQRPTPPRSKARRD